MGQFQSGKTDNTFTHRYGYSPNTLSVTSNRCRVMTVNSTGQYAQVGVMSTFDPNESRNIETVRGIGYGDKIAELVPGATDAMTISVNRTAQYLQNIYQAFGYKGGVQGLVRSLRQHRWPFDIDQEIVMAEMLQSTAQGGLVTGVGKDPSVFDNGSFGATGSTPGFSNSDSAWELGQMDENGDPAITLKAIVTRYVGCWFSSWSTSYAADQALVQENCEIMVTDVYDLTADDSAAVDDVSGKSGIYGGDKNGTDGSLETLYTGAATGNAGNKVAYKGFYVSKDLTTAP